MLIEHFYQIIKYYQYSRTLKIKKVTPELTNVSKLMIPLGGNKIQSGGATSSTILLPQ